MCHWQLGCEVAKSCSSFGDVNDSSLPYSTKFSQVFNFANFANFQPFTKMFQ